MLAPPESFLETEAFKPREIERRNCDVAVTFTETKTRLRWRCRLTDLDNSKIGVLQMLTINHPRTIHATSKTAVFRDAWHERMFVDEPAHFR